MYDLSKPEPNESCAGLAIASILQQGIQPFDKADTNIPEGLTSGQCNFGTIAYFNCTEDPLIHAFQALHRYLAAIMPIRQSWERRLLIKDKVDSTFLNAMSKNAVSVDERPWLPSGSGFGVTHFAQSILMQSYALTTAIAYVNVITEG
jgi:hypothetical protein